MEYDRTVKKRNLLAVDLFRVLCALMVIYIHTRPLRYIDIKLDYILSNVVSRIAVPFFLVAAGYFLNSKFKNGFKSVWKYVKHILILYCVWSAVYFPYVIKGHVQEYGLVGGMLSYLRYFLFIGGHYHLWYLSSLAVGVLVMYLVYKFFKYKGLIIMGFLCVLVGLTTQLYYGLVESTYYGELYNIYSRFFGEYYNSYIFVMPFITIGMLVKEKGLKWKKYMWLVLLLVMATQYIEVVFTWTGHISRDTNVSISLLFISPLLLMLMIHLSDYITIKYDQAVFVRKLTLNIYTSHVAFIIIGGKLLEYIGVSDRYYYVLLFGIVVVSSLVFAIILETLQGKIHRHIQKK